MGYEKTYLPYTIRKLYLADFTVELGQDLPRGTKAFYIESKGWFRPEDRVKMRAVKEENPDLDIRFVFPKDNKLSSKSKMRYSEWCKKYNFKYHIGTDIPKDWFKE